MRSIGLWLIGSLLVLQCAVSVFALLDAICVLQATEVGEPYGIKGTVRFTSNSNGTVRVQAEITGNSKFKAQSQYAMHVHAYGDITDHIAGETCGPHWTPIAGQQHNCPPTTTRHSGDMGNWTQANGKIVETKELDLLEMTLASSLVGRSVVLHQNHDNCAGTNGDSGARLAICVIGITNEDYNYATANEQTDGASAVCHFTPTEHCKGHCHGNAFFKLDAFAKTGITAEFTISQKGVHAFHIQTYGDMRSEKGELLGEDFNPFGRPHGLPPSIPRHIGDLGNIQTYDKNGTAWYHYEDTYFTPVHTVLGRSMAVYERADNGRGEDCSNTGSAGKIIMQCVIGLTNPVTLVPPIPKGLKIDVHFDQHNCPSEEEENSEDAEAGLIGGLVFGWVMVALLLVVIVAIFSYFLYLKRRGARFDVIPVQAGGHSYGSEL
eukprot:TRINITY_DN475_c0_g1_i1.p1 TRINITY_DN475_c0_g1~~TRINITY_DN475_c0_g1_i1.p1  ORF type:complete len:449 (-),score=45.08 TRINITY_DN475_c0_g1_i1:79-1383(-)